MVRCRAAAAAAARAPPPPLPPPPTPLFLDHFLAHFSRVFPVVSPFPPSWPQDSGNRHQCNGRKTVAYLSRRALLAGAGRGPRRRRPEENTFSIWFFQKQSLETDLLVVFVRARRQPELLSKRKLVLFSKNWELQKFLDEPRPPRAGPRPYPSQYLCQLGVFTRRFSTVTDRFRSGSWARRGLKRVGQVDIETARSRDRAACASRTPYTRYCARLRRVRLSSRSRELWPQI